jgi:glycine cleavage system H protein
MTFDQSVKYQDSHEWVRKDGDVVVVGISDYAQDSLGDVVYVELPEVGATRKKGEPFGVVESVKAASDVYMPVSGEIVEINSELEDNPSTVNDAPFEAGWLIKIRPDDASGLDTLMSASEYEEYVKGLDE